jgi:hypothetical protein
MEIKEIISYYFDQDTKRIDVSFRLTIDSDDEVRSDIVKVEEAKEFGYDIITEEIDIFDFSDDEDYEDDDDDFVTVDEDILLSYLNEYYIVYPNKLPKSDVF